ncbi:type II toxin-antitoxin system RelE/ParE family toxin [Phenylobacterium sp.]|uniref:type II toxin-antitoxin system RelE/ParE family toxin n=1 Tax=Phenylobacterium sp. TaxID=1871053 RepID=UPI00301E5AF9
MNGKFEVVMTAAAEQDLADIVEYVRAHGSERAASTLLDEFLACVATLEDRPARGAVPSELAPLGVTDYRQLRLRRYRLIYRIHEATVAVMVVADSRRDMQALLERRLLGS